MWHLHGLGQASDFYSAAIPDGNNGASAASLYQAATTRVPYDPSLVRDMPIVADFREGFQLRNVGAAAAGLIGGAALVYLLKG